MVKTAKTYRELQAELDAIMAWFDSDEVDIDQAVAKYEEGMRIVKALEAQLTEAENKIEAISSKFAGK